ncbi:nuclear GTP-binding protein nug1 [Emydomyces testavorans]|uniref:Nuclear GTP-binding protein nug1 n=1 Tax=Emydomyces testavorans TaxID=2070801 RepID=A0AAF0DNQ9_9EURO|nr:nuclear GTP-binding protein nug1 [Emydomyces testavorans]
MVKLGKNSKRTPVRLRHKIEKASAAKQRKQRKLAKKNPQWRSKLKKDPGIPNLFPYKDQLLHEIEERKRLKEEEILRTREEARQKHQAAGADSRPDAEPMQDEELNENLLEEDMEDDRDQSNPMAALLESAKARAAEYAEQNEDEGFDETDKDFDRMEEDHHGFDDHDNGTPQELSFGPRSKETSRRAFDKMFKQIIEAADVILYVLDARDPEGTRSKEVEREIMAADGGSKRLILILNKIDLVPPAVLKGWLLHFRRYFPTLPLRASTGAAGTHSYDHKQLTAKATSETLFKALKSYAHNKQLKRSISVGVIGYPNVGKSSVINALTSRLKGATMACPVGAEAGVTTSLREVRLDSKIKLIDSPGIVFPNSNTSKSSSKNSNEEARLILLNAIPPKQISDPLSAVTLILNRLSSSQELFSKMLEFYGIPPLFPLSGDKTNDFLVQVARKRGRLGKGGIPNINSAAMTVITDWRDGRIQGWVQAPSLDIVTSTSAAVNTASNTGIRPDIKHIVSEWSKEFMLEELWGDHSDSQQSGEIMQ